MKYKPLIQNHQEFRNFDYQKGEVQLKFSLRIDRKNQLTDFKDLLEQAVIDVKKELEK